MLLTVLEEGFSPPPTSSIGWYSHLSCRLFYGIGGPSEFVYFVATLVRKSSQDGFKMIPECLWKPPPGNPGGHPGAPLAGGGGAGAEIRTFFEENGSQDGGQNRQKINKKLFQNLKVFYPILKTI